MKKHTFFTMLCVLLVLTGCQKRQEQTDIRLPESESAVTEETITVPSEKPEEALPEESAQTKTGERFRISAPTKALEVLQTLQTLEDWKSSPEYEMITAQKEKVLSQLIRSFYHGQDSLSLRDTAWGDRDLPGMAFEVFRSLLGSEDLEQEAETPLEWFGRGLSGRSDIFMKQTQKDCKHSIRLLMPQFIRYMDHRYMGGNSVTTNLDRVQSVRLRSLRGERPDCVLHP